MGVPREFWGFRRFSEVFQWCSRKFQRVSAAQGVSEMYHKIPGCLRSVTGDHKSFPEPFNWYFSGVSENLRGFQDSLVRIPK